MVDAIVALIAGLVTGAMDAYEAVAKLVDTVGIAPYLTNRARIRRR